MEKLLNGLIGLAFIVGVVYFIKWLFTPKKRPLARPLSIADFNQASETEKRDLFVEWCRRKGVSLNRRRSETQLDEYVTDHKLPTFYQWKSIHNVKGWAPRSVYSDWLKFIGAYNPKFDPDHPDWEVR